MDYITDYDTSKVAPGAIFESNNFGQFRVLGRDRKSKSHYWVQFIKTGYIRKAYITHIFDGELKDKMHPHVEGVGYLGEGKWRPTCKGKITREGQAWYGMMMRCYNKAYLKITPTYAGCSVCDRWLCFQNFCEDIKNLPGYDKWINRGEKRYVLDKDTLVPGNKVYGPDTCAFIYEGDNTAASNKSVSVYEGTSPDGQVYYFRNQRAFAESHGLVSRGISACVTGEQQTHRKWSFKRLTTGEIAQIPAEDIQD